MTAFANFTPPDQGRDHRRRPDEPAVYPFTPLWQQTSFHGFY